MTVNYDFKENVFVIRFRTHSESLQYTSEQINMFKNCIIAVGKLKGNSDIMKANFDNEAVFIDKIWS